MRKNEEKILTIFQYFIKTKNNLAKHKNVYYFICIEKLIFEKNLCSNLYKNLIQSGDFFKNNFSIQNTL